MEQMTVKHVDASTPLTCDWDAPAWSNAETGSIEHFMGSEPAHLPAVQFRLAYDDEAIRVIFRVEDQLVRAVAERFHDAVCRDSCVELFFTPGPDVDMGYFNFEFSCCGVMLARFQPEPGIDLQDLSESDCCAVEIVRSIPDDQIDPERVGPLTWTLAARIPFELLEHYSPAVATPKPGIQWRGNAYKCADRTSGPHWLTWSPIDWDGPNFHLPQFFGQLDFA